VLRTVTAIIATTALLTLTSCGDDDPSPATPSPSPSATSAPPSESPSASATQGATASPSPTEKTGLVIEVRFSDGSVEPNGERVKAKVGEPILLRITAEGPGEIHVHSSPEQELAYKAGTSDLELVIDKPGVVDVESHDLGQVIVQLEVAP
jgi:hypothetical protein